MGERIRVMIVALSLLCSIGVKAQDDGSVMISPPLDFDSAALETVVGAIFAKAGLQFSVEGELQGKVTIHLTEPMAIENLLDMILIPKGIRWRLDERTGVYKIGGVKEQVATITKIYPLTYAAVGSDVVKLVRTAMSEVGIINTDVGTNSLIIQDQPSAFPGIEEIIKQVDVEGRKPKLIQIKAKLIEISRTDTFEWGLAWSWDVNDPDIADEDEPFHGLYVNFQKTLTETAGISLNQPLRFVQDINEITAYIFAGSAINSVDLLSEPDVVVEDGTEAKIVVGRREPIMTRSETSSGTETYSYTYQDVNTILTVTPMSQRDGTISLALTPEINQIAGYRTQLDTEGFVAATVPIIDNRIVQTKLYVKNGGTIRLGGLLQTRTTTTEQRLPFLGDIPILGLLFKYTSPKVEKVELVLLVSPHIVDTAPPRSKDTPWVSKLRANQLEGSVDVLVDWSEDMPFGANGLFKIKVFRSHQPITTDNVARIRPIVDNLSPDATSWVDATRKGVGSTYYYVVVATNPSGMEQSAPPDPNFNARITITRP